MGGNNNQHDRNSLRMILWLVWISLTFSLLIYAVVPILIPPPPEFTPPEIATGTPPKILVILGLASVVLIPMLFSIRKKMFYDPIGDKCSPGTTEARSAYFTMALTSWIMVELVGVFGFIIYFLTYQLVFAIPFVVLAMILMLIFWPDPEAAEGG